MDVRASYDSAAQVYTDHLAGELADKPLDRHLLNRFAETMRDRGLVADLGCGPGHIARYLHERGVTVVGIDLSHEMIACARQLNPELDFRVGDMSKLDFADGALSGIVAFYSIVHFDIQDLDAIMREMRRVLVAGGLLLLSFHVGDDVVHVDELFGAPVSLDFRFHQPDAMIEVLQSARFTTVERADREPYEGVEYPSRRCYLLARAIS
jgi:SAM-dependent methyltransferase